MSDHVEPAQIASEQGTEPGAKPFAAMTIDERLALLAAEPKRYEQEMEREALAHQQEFQRTGRITAIGGDPADPRTLPGRIGKWGRR